MQLHSLYVHLYNVPRPAFFTFSDLANVVKSDVRGYVNWPCSWNEREARVEVKRGSICWPPLFNGCDSKALVPTSSNSIFLLFHRVAILPSFFRKNRQNFHFSRNKSYNIDIRPRWWYEIIRTIVRVLPQRQLTPLRGERLLPGMQRHSKKCLWLLWNCNILPHYTGN